MTIKNDPKKFINLSLYTISLIMAAIAILMEIEVVDEIIDSEIFLGIALILVIVLGLMNTMNKNK